jgi:ERCC4-type nuclease
MKIIIDEREENLYHKCNTLSIIMNTLMVYKEVLPIGDIEIKTVENKPILIIERKSLSDLLASIKDGRYEEQSYRLIHSSGYPSHCIVYVIEGMISQFNNPKDKKLIYSAMTSLNYFKGMSVFRTCNTQETAELIIYMSDKISRNLLKGIPPAYLIRQCSQSLDIKPSYDSLCGSILLHDTTLDNMSHETIENLVVPSPIVENMHSIVSDVDYCSVVKKVKKDNITTENIGQIILSQIPGISSVTSIAIMKHFNSFPHFIREIQQTPTVLDNIYIETNGKKRKINKTSIESILKYFT